MNGTDQSGQNLYIDEVLAYPHIFEKAKKVVEMCTEENRYGMMLKMIYVENELADQK